MLVFSAQDLFLREIHSSMNVICLEDAAFDALIDKVIARVKESVANTSPDPWVSGEEAMGMLRITSKTTLQKLRDEGKIRFSQPEKKLILYDTASIHAYLNQHANDRF